MRFGLERAQFYPIKKKIKGRVETYKDGPQLSPQLKDSTEQDGLAGKAGFAAIQELFPFYILTFFPMLHERHSSFVCLGLILKKDPFY